VIRSEKKSVENLDKTKRRDKEEVGIKSFP
jgi:hypothetical protein